MKKQGFTIAACLSLAAAGLMGQGVGVGVGVGANFQEAGTIASGVGWQVFPAGGRGGGLVTGSPMSAKEVNKTVQTLSDGTELENSHSTMIYRDSQGRMRNEPSGPDANVQITDPVAALRITLNPAKKTAIRANAPALAAGGRGVTYTYTSTSTAGGTVTTSTTAQAAEDLAKVQAELAVLSAARGAATTKNQSNTEDLGFQVQNGVMAQGTRTTLIIPAGQIGNNRDIHVVNERWYSKDLQMMVKSVNSDPRFGVTTYELTNISQNAPDPTLFQIPTGYTITDGPGRGPRLAVPVGK